MKVLKPDLTDDKICAVFLHQTSLVVIRRLFSLITLLYFGIMLFWLIENGGMILSNHLGLLMNQFFETSDF